MEFLFANTVRTPHESQPQRRRDSTAKLLVLRPIDRSEDSVNEPAAQLLLAQRPVWLAGSLD
jgi:phytoene/squalene synthetase